ncbi:MAG: hypothetical protein QOE68_362, partial [Thermoanaerobaculia bacterium]|nr:hypothetical protein [Thermoanaerobaculia bacterium]
MLLMLLDSPSTQLGKNFKGMPEGHALRQISWQLFVTLTFRDPPRRPRRLKLLFAFLREIADADPNIHFHDLLWCARWEKKLPDGV